MKNSDLSLSKAHKKKLAHFANIIKLARVDFVINDEEQELLDRLAKLLGIEKQEYKKVLENPDAYPINPPVTYDERIERLYNLTDMIFIDGEIIGDEVDLLQRIAIDLGFPTDIIEKISDKAIHLIINNYNLDEFKSAIKEIYKI
ncbi:MAG: TerB family tellurite resistance protein [Flavobacteriaceae bacterium]|nr:TerB family tellurite resistance protein [Flavobacteriaceae bacterium]